jgi:hypothetical protein
MLVLCAVKKIISLLLVLLLLFNALGFYGLFIGLRHKSKLDLVQRLDREQYSEDETITLKIPISIPYQMDSEYERVDGEVEHQGAYYRLIKQKLQSDTLYLVCIKDHASTRMKQALTDYVKTFTDKPADGKHGNKTPNTFIKDFLLSKIAISPVTEGWTHSIALTSKKFDLLHADGSISSPPPKAVRS